jgi:hypothetical protein
VKQAPAFAVVARHDAMFGSIDVIVIAVHEIADL